MSSQDQDYEDDDQQDNLRDLREAAERGKASKAEAEAAKRELAFAKAGIDTDSKQGKMFVKAYDGDLDKTAIKTEFAEMFGIGDVNGTEQLVEQEAAEEQKRQQTQERRDLTSQAPEHAEPPPPDLIKDGYAKYEAAMASGVPQERAFRDILEGHIGAAAAGQAGATWNGWTPEEMDGY